MLSELIMIAAAVICAAIWKGSKRFTDKLLGW
jgi:hypothetical protein